MQAYDVASHLAEATGLGTDVDTSPNQYGVFRVRFMSGDNSPAGIMELFHVGIRLEFRGRPGGQWTICTPPQSIIPIDTLHNLQGIIDMYQDED